MTEATTHRSTDRPRPDRGPRTRPRLDLLWRAALPAAALVALVAGAPRGVSGGLALAGLALAVELLCRRRGLGLLDALLAGVGGLLAVVILAGMALGAAGARLETASWVISLAVLGLVGLGVAAVLPARTPTTPAESARMTRRLGAGGTTPRRTALGLLPWVALAGVVAVVAVQMTSTALEATEAAPVSLSLGDVDGNRVQVVVASSEATGPLEVRTSSADGETSYPLVEVPADGSTTTTVALPETGRFEITLSNPGQTEPLRTLVLDR